MSLPDIDPLGQGACMDLPPAVVDKFFGASQRDNPFEHTVAKMICGRCAVRAECLEAAISEPGIIYQDGYMIRGGESGWAIQNMRRRHFLGGESVRAIVDAAMATTTKIDIGAFRRLRRGKFDDAQLAIPVIRAEPYITCVRRSAD